MMDCLHSSGFLFYYNSFLIHLLQTILYFLILYFLPMLTLFISSHVTPQHYTANTNFLPPSNSFTGNAIL